MVPVSAAPSRRRSRRSCRNRSATRARSRSASGSRPSRRDVEADRDVREREADAPAGSPVEDKPRVLAGTVVSRGPRAPGRDRAGRVGRHVVERERRAADRRCIAGRRGCGRSRWPAAPSRRRSRRSCRRSRRTRAVPSGFRIETFARSRRVPIVTPESLRLTRSPATPLEDEAAFPSPGDVVVDGHRSPPGTMAGNPTVAEPATVRVPSRSRRRPRQSRSPRRCRDARRSA